MEDYDDIEIQHAQQLDGIISGHQLETNALLDSNKRLQAALCRSKEEIKSKDRIIAQKDNEIAEQNALIAQLRQRILDLQKPTYIANIQKGILSAHNLVMGDNVGTKIMQYQSKEYAT